MTIEGTSSVLVVGQRRCGLVEFVFSAFSLFYAVSVFLVSWLEWQWTGGFPNCRLCDNSPLSGITRARDRGVCM
jgi:hypothetical protein